MKFTDGYWLIREGMRVINPAEIRDIRLEENRVQVYAACRSVRHKGDTLNEPLISVEYSTPMPDIIKVKVAHHLGKKKAGPEFKLNTDKNVNTVINNTEREICMESGGLGVRISKNEGWKIDFSYGGRRITGNGSKSTGYIKDDENNAFIREQLDLGVGECIYGLGERFTSFVKNGQTVDVWNQDGGTSSEQAYKNIPFYISNKGYGVFVNHPECVSFEIGSENVSKVQFSVPGETLEYFIIGGESIKKVLENYTRLTGRPALPPAWTFGLWLTTSFTTSYDEATVNSFIDGMVNRDIPLSVFHFDCFWMKEYQWCDFEWDSAVFPEPENMLKRLKDKGLKICVWINSYIAQKSPLFEEAVENGFLLKTKEGDAWQWDKWQAGMGLVDFTNPEAVKWYKSKLKKLLDMGVDCFKTDFGERIPTDVAYFDGSDPMKAHNYYTYLYNKAVFELLEEVKGKKEAAVFARSATVGSQKFPVHWGGDCSATYESMAESLRGGLSLCLSGFGFWSHDISGFEKTAPPDIYKRWVAFGMLSSHSRLHGNESYRVPWLFDEEAVDVLRHFTKLKCSLMPYLFKTACEAANSGVPMMRAMLLEFPDDPGCYYLDRQYMLGDSLLIAPIFSEAGEVSYYLPEGMWTNLLSGEKVNGGGWRKEKHDYFSLPLMIRPNSIIPIGKNNTRPDYDYAHNVTLHVFELQDGEISCTVNNMDGEPELVVSVLKNGQSIDVEVKLGADKPWDMVFRGIHGFKSVANAKAELVELGLMVIPKGDAKRITVEI